jgi:hypothetical protein
MDAGSSAPASRTMEMTLRQCDNEGGSGWGGRFSDHLIHTAHEYWRRKAAGRSMPSRADIDPAEIASLLPHVMLVDVLDDGGYRYRLIGTETAAKQGVNATGMRLTEAIPDPHYRAHVISLYDECVRERRPLYSERVFFGADGIGPERHMSNLFMPLSNTGVWINMIFAIVIYARLTEEARRRHFVNAPPFREIAHVLT